MGEEINLMTGWEKTDPVNGEDVWYNDERKVMIFSNNELSTLVKENEIFLEFKSDNHLLDAVRKSDEIFATQYAKPH